MTLKGFTTIEYLVDKKLANSISEVIVGEDGNTVQDYSKEIFNLCTANNIPVFYRSDKYTINGEYSIAISWRWLITSKDSKLIILHDSLLPKYRGFAPLVNSLINREKEIGVTALFADKKYDTGDIIDQLSIEVQYPITIQTAINLITQCYVRLIHNIVLQLQTGSSLDASTQDESEATYSLWRNEEDYLIDWSDSAKNIQQFINSVSFPYMGASTFINGKEKIRILETEVVPNVEVEIRQPGKVIFVEESHPIIVCGSGLLKITKATNAKSKNILPFKNFRVRLTNYNLPTS